MEINDKIIHLLQNPSEAAPQDRFLIQEAIEKIPYFQPLHLLLLRSFKDEKDNPTYKKALKLASIYTTNREVLYNFVYNRFSKENLTQKSMPKKIVSKEEDKEIENEVVKEEFVSAETLDTTLPVDGAADNLEETKKDDATPLNHTVAFSEKEEAASPVGDTISTKEVRHKENIADSFIDITQHVYSKAIGYIEEIEEDTTYILKIQTDQKSTFIEWLQPMSKSKKKKHKKKAEKKIKKKQKKQKQIIIDRFLEGPQKISPIREPSKENKKNIERKEQFNLMTETLANLYVEQKKYDRAIISFEKLKLIYPEKISFFADQIKKVEKLKKDGNL